MFHRPDVIKDKLYVITSVFNPQRFRSRWKLYKYFEQYIVNSGAHLFLVEASFGEREKVFKEEVGDHLTIIHVRTKHEIWIKENLINIAMQFLPDEWKYVAWLDADVSFARPDWVGETLQQLQHYKLIQMFSQAVDMSPSFEIIKQFKSWMWCYQHECPNMPACDYYYHSSKHSWHPGFAWAARREAINDLGGLIDWAILGSGDRHMAAALIGEVKSSVNSDMHGRYITLLDEWQKRAETYIKRNVGYMEGLLIHYWHGKKADRKYKDRWRILIDNQYNPDVDIKRSTYGVFQLTDRSIKLRDDAMRYFKMRNEDSVDL